MAASSTHPSREESTSFTAMSTADVDAIGAHCQAAFCHQLDFLPFRCESCKGKYCLEHRTETAHACPNQGAWARARTQRLYGSATATTPTQKPSLLQHERQCYEKSCKILVDTPLTPAIQCPTCNRSYCLRHRLKEDHDCANVKPLGARQTQAASQQAQTREKGLAALDKLRAWGASKKAVMNSTNTPSPSAVSTRPGAGLFKGKETKRKEMGIAAINNLKAKARGDIKIPSERRIYLSTEASVDTTIAKHPSAPLFVSSEWSVGRMLDFVAKELQVQNLNNRVAGEEDRLRVFFVEGGRLLEFGEKVGETLRNGNTVVLLRGVGTPAPT